MLALMYNQSQYCDMLSLIYNQCQYCDMLYYLSYTNVFLERQNYKTLPCWCLGCLD